MRRFFLAIGAALLIAAATVSIPQSSFAQTGIPTERVLFRPGATSTVITRTIKGRQTIDFVVNAKQGQQLAASMTSKSLSAYFNILAPGETDIAFYVGDGYPANSFKGTVPKSGDLKFRVYLNRAAARRGESATIRLTIALTGAGGAPTQLPSMPHGGGHATQLPGDATVPGTHYHATGKVNCRNGAGFVGMCDFGVRRHGAGNGSVTITRPDGRTRTIFFEKGNPVGYDFSQADPAPFKWSRKIDEVTVMIGAEQYVLFDAIINGG